MGLSRFPAWSIVVCLGVAAAAATGRQTASAATPGSGDWPSLGRDPRHAAYAPDPKMNVSAAGKLGVAWMSQLYGADLGSPGVAYNTVLKKNIVYVGDERGDLRAIDEASGTTVWSTSLGPGAGLRSSPLVVGGDVWIGTSYPGRFEKVDGATGQILCSVSGSAPFLASPNTTTIGGTTLVYDSTIDEAAFSGPVDAVDANSCAKTFSFLDFKRQTGAYASPALATDALGRNLLLFGTADPDSKEYAIDAATGARYWYFQAANPFPGIYDIGAAASISPPGANGVADGMAFVSSKYGIMYGLDLTTGAEDWEFNYDAAAGVTGEGGQSTPAIFGNTIVFGYNSGVFAVNATTGAPLWQWVNPTGATVIANPAIAGTGSPANVVVGIADEAGFFRVLRLSDGQQLYAYQTNGYITGSVAETNGHFVVSSSDGFVYDFAAGGSNTAASGATGIASPTSGASVAYAGGKVVVSGYASDPAGVKAVDVAVRAGGAYGPWYDAASKNWSSGAIPNPVTVSHVGAPYVSWRFTLPVSPAGDTYAVYANETNVRNQTDRTGMQSTFTVKPSKTAALLHVAPAIVAPGAPFTVTGTGFAPGETVTFTVADSTIGSATSSSKGSVGPTTLVLPTNEDFGVAALVGTGATAGDVSDVPIDVENSWPQAGDGPAHGSFEANDSVFRRVLHVGPGIFIQRAWYAPTGAAIETSPAVVAGVAYTGNDAGTLNAVQTLNSAPVWSYTIPSGAPIRSSPAIDGGLAIFGADDGSLYRLSAATGVPAAAPIALGGGALTSPAVVGGEIVIASRQGKVWGINEGSGAIQWHFDFGEPISSSVAVDAPGSTVIVTGDEGHIGAFSTATGARVWRTEIGGALKTSPAIVDHSVYVGSTNGNLIVLNEATGSVTWTYAVGAAIEAAPAIANGNDGFVGDSIYVGSDDGYVTALDSATQKSVWRIPFNSSVVGLGATLGNLVFVETADGLATATRGPNDGFDFWRFQTAGTLDTSPTVNDGAVYVGAGDGGLYAFTPYGQEPQSVRAPARGAAAVRGAIARAPVTAGSALVTYEGAQTRSFPLRVARTIRGSAASTGLRAHGGPVQAAPRTYAIIWHPAGTFMSPHYAAALARALAARRTPAPLAGVAIDTATPFSGAPLGDAAAAAEIQRMAGRAHWAVDANAQFVLVVAREAFGAVPGFCAYHSAIAVGGSAAAYAVVPYPGGADACGSGAAPLPATGDADADRELPVLVREQRDIATDPLGNAWYDAAGREAGDVAGASR